MQVENREKRQILLDSIAKTIKQIRKKSGKSISLISDEINLSKSIWSDVEIGKTDIQISTFWRIAEALDTEPDILIRTVKNNLVKNFTFME